VIVRTPSAKEAEVGPVADIRVQDRDVLEEIELYGDLIIAASGSDGPLTTAQIDDVLGVSSDIPRQGGAA
jgi:hypothetical protein